MELKMERKTIGILFGGRSTEYEISLQSAYAVLQALDLTKYEPVMVGITRQGEWFWYRGDPERIPAGTWDQWAGEENCLPCVLSQSPETHGLLILRDGRADTLRLDAALPILHGKNGEDGTVQGLLELSGIPVGGCKTLCSALCMDKEFAHMAAREAGIAVPRGFSVRRGQYDPLLGQQQAQRVGYPLFVKPARAGSSFGITRVTAPEELDEALRIAFSHDRKAVVEQEIEGFEVGCAVMGASDGELTVGEVDEIELSGGFFDFTEKYTPKSSQIHLPARIEPETRERIKRTAKTLYRVLDCDGFARVDCFLTPTGQVVFNEVNTIPGMTAHSRFPGMMREAGISLGQIVTRLLEEAEASQD